MSVLLTVGRVKFSMPRGCEAAALRALLRRHEREHLYHGDDLPAATTFDAAMAVLGWQVRRHDNRVRGLHWIGLSSSVDAQVPIFEALAKLVEPGSYIELEDDYSNQPTRLELDGRRCRLRKIREVGAEEDVLESDDRANARPTEGPSFADIRDSKPPERSRYSPSMAAAADQWIDHPTYGAGKVLRLLDGKIEVLFEVGRKILLARTGPG